MSLSTIADINNDNHDSNQFYVSSQEQQQDIDASNKRKHTSIAPSPLTFLTPLQISPRFRELHWCLVTDVLPFHSVLDLKNTMLNNGLYYDFCHEDNKQYLSLDSVHLGQHLDITDDDIPTHAIWICNGESGYNDVLNTLTKHGILDTHIIQTHARLQAYDSLRLLPLDNDIEDPSQIAKMWKKNCPDGLELTLYHHIKLKDDAALQHWVAKYRGKTQYHGKSARSL